MPAPKDRSKVNKSRLGQRLELRTVKLLKEQGYEAEKVSRAGRHGPQDLLGVVDIVAMDHAGTVLFVQVTTESAASEHRRKIRARGLKTPVKLVIWAIRRGRWVVKMSEDIMGDTGAAHGASLQEQAHEWKLSEDYKAEGVGDG